MADKTVLISQQTSKPIKILKWKVGEGNTISIGSIVLLYSTEEVVKFEQRKLKSTKAGKVYKIIGQEGTIINPGEPLFQLEECIHPTVMRDMCAECGADLRKDDLNSTASVPMIHAVPDLKVSEELAQKLGKADSERLIKDRKLVLLVDLDQTLIHTTNDIIPPNLKDVYHFQLYGPHSPWYHTRLRPGTHEFLKHMAIYFELHICTFGARNYAHQITALLDADGCFFSNRVLSRDECFNATSKTANLKALFPCGDNMVCIIDDREDVWSHAANLIHVKPYHFFQHTGDINAPPGLDKHEDDDKEGVDLSKVKNIIKNENEKNGVIEESEDLSYSKNNVSVVLDDEEENKLVQNQESTNENHENANNLNQNEEIKTKNNGENKIIENEKKVDMENVESKESDVPHEAVENVRNGMDNADVIECQSKPRKDNEKLDLIEVDDPDDYLLHLEDILKRIHKAFYDEYDKSSAEVPDLKKVIPRVKNQVLKDTKLVFSGLVPTHIQLEYSKAYQIARSLGAQVTANFENGTTHLIAVRPGTAKVNAGKRKKNLKIVTPDWLWSCAERWEHVEEKMFPLNSKGSKNRHPPPHCSSPEHIINIETHNTPAARKRSPSGRFMDTINPLMSFSSADIADMDKEVEDILDDESESDSDETNNKCNIVLKKKEQDSSSEESLTGELPRGYKRTHERLEEDPLDENVKDTDDELPSAKFRRAERLDSDLDIGDDSNSGEGSIDAPDEMDDGEWNMMGAALEREFLSND